MSVLVKEEEVVERATQEEWEPHIVALICNWCTYAGADMAGVARRTYAPNVRAVRFLCTGRIDPVFIIKAFEEGADGVLVSGCHPGDCHYVQGNMLARRRLSVFRAFMEFLGLDPRRLHFAWVSASEGVKWAKVVDDVVASVREAGPLGQWGKPTTARPSSPLILPDAGQEPRSVPSEEENERITARLRETAATLLKDETLSLVIGYSPGPMPGQMVPTFVAHPEEADRLAWNERCSNNLSVYLPKALQGRKNGKVGVVVKSCDANAVVGLLRENQIQRGQVLLISIPCAGLWENGKLALKCYSCPEEVSSLSDLIITKDGVEEGVASVEPRPADADPRDAQISVLKSLSTQERWDYWQHQFERCIRCYACRAVCPLCYCETCIVEKNRPQWIPTTIDGPGNTSWNITRAMHLAGRCIGCDECTRVCPADIRLDLLNRQLALEIENRFDYRCNTDPNLPPPLTTFRPDDPDEFL